MLLELRDAVEIAEVDKREDILRSELLWLAVEQPEDSLAEVRVDVLKDDLRLRRLLHARREERVEVGRHRREDHLVAAEGPAVRCAAHECHIRQRRVVELRRELRGDVERDAVAVVGRRRRRVRGRVLRRGGVLGEALADAARFHLLL